MRAVGYGVGQLQRGWQQGGAESEIGSAACFIKAYCFSCRLIQ